MGTFNPTPTRYVLGACSKRKTNLGITTVPFGVRRFPGSRDPRGATFCAEGFAFGGVPAIVYRFSTTGALAPFDLLNGAGVVLGLTLDSPGHREWVNTDFTANHLSASWQIDGAYLGLDPGPTFSVNWSFAITSPGEDLYFGQAVALYPDAINGWPTIAMAPAGIGINKIPNPLLVTPCIWDTVLTS